MIRGLYYSARGMAVESKKQEVISNNMANSNTTGYKKDILTVRSFSELLLERIAGVREVPLGGMGQSPLLDHVVTSFAPGMLEETQRSLDLASVGNAFFAVETPQGVRYTKDGGFDLDRDGFLVTSDGYYVLGADGGLLQPGTEDIRVDEDGFIWIGGEENFAGQLMLAVFDQEDLEQLRKVGQNLFEAEEVAPLGQGLGQVRQGFLENSNVQILREMMDMITVMRTYEANQKSLQAHDEILGKSINEVGTLR